MKKSDQFPEINNTGGGAKMIKAKQRVEKLEQKTGETKRTIFSMALNNRVTRVFDETWKDMPEHKGCIGMDIEELKKSLTAYYEDEEKPSLTTINSAVPRPRDQRPTRLEIINRERIFTDDIKDLTPGEEQPESLEERTDKERSLEVEELSEAEREEIQRMTNEELDQEIERVQKEIENDR